MVSEELLDIVTRNADVREDHNTSELSKAKSLPPSFL